MFISAKVWKNDPFVDWNKSNICRQCILKEKKNSIAKQTETSCDQNNIWDKYFLMIQQKKRDTCRQVWRWKMKKIGPSLVWNNWNICRQCILKEKKNFIAKQTETSCDQNSIWANIFWWYSKKSATSVDKCDDEKKWPIPGLKQLKHLRTMYFKGEKEFHCETDWDEPWPKQYMGQIFSDDRAKKAGQV